MDKNQQLLRNLRIYPYFRFFFNLLIIGPILVPFMLFKGLNYSQIMILQSISAIAVFIFEVPTGAIADKVSRRISLMLSGFFIGTGLLIYIIFDSFYVFALAEIIFGIGLTFSSGADAAILYESLTRLERQREYQKKEGEAASLVFIGHAVGSVLSSFLYVRSPFLPFWCSIGSIIAAIFISFGFSDTERKKSEHTYPIHVLRSIKVAVQTPRIFWTILFAALMGFAFRTSFWLYQPYFVRVNIDIKWYGLIFFYFNMMAAFASKFLIKKYYDTRPRKILITLAFLLSATYIVPALLVHQGMIFLLGLQQIVRGLYQPTLRFYINHHIMDEYRATVISLVSLSASLGFALLSPLVGLSLDHQGTIPTYIWMGTVTLGGVVMLTLLRRLQKSRKSNRT
ncbi:MAG: MFS transporter [Candidatus Cloacimonetes bacterium]|nr:MFS transporter [Candidatus Cloacimonadota bacterium]